MRFPKLVSALAFSIGLLTTAFADEPKTAASIYRDKVVMKDGAIYWCIVQPSDDGTLSFMVDDGNGGSALRRRPLKKVKSMLIAHESSSGPARDEAEAKFTDV